MRKILFLVALVLAGAARAAPSTYVFAEGSTSITLTDEPCTSPKVLALLAKTSAPPGLEKALREAHIRYQGRAFDGCYVQNRGVVLLLDDEGDTSRLPVEAFEPGTDS